MAASKVSLSLPDDLKAWWDILPDQTRAKTVHEIIRRSKNYKDWKMNRGDVDG